jgi:hypothetical protein
VWKNGGDRVGQPQYVAHVVANATCCFACVTLAPGVGIEGVAEFALESQGEPGGQVFAAEPSFEACAQEFRSRQRAPSGRNVGAHDPHRLDWLRHPRRGHVCDCVPSASASPGRGEKLRMLRLTGCEGRYVLFAAAAPAWRPAGKRSMNVRNRGPGSGSPLGQCL